MNLVLWMGGALLSFCAMAIGGRELAGKIDIFQMLFIRSLLGLGVVSLIIYGSGQRNLFRTARGAVHLWRNIFHFAGQYGWFVGIALLPLAEVFALEFTVPIWTVLIAGILLKEQVTAPKCLALLLGVAGTYVILRPGSEVIDSAAMVVLASAACFAVAHVSVKVLAQTEHPLTVLFYMCLMQLPISLVLSVGRWTTATTVEWLWLCVVAVTALTAHFCLTRAMQLAETGTVVILDFLRLPLIGVAGIVLYNETFDLALLVGSGLMLLGNLVNIRQHRVATK